MTVLALVLTHGAPDALVACVRALLAQSIGPDDVLVIDNAGTPDAVTTLQRAGVVDERVHVLRRPDNDGPAGGHAAGLGALLASSHRLGWVLDDDCAPEPGCLQALLATVAPTAVRVLRLPLRIEPDGSARSAPAWSGVLLGRDVVEEVGVPRAELVWWGEDTEYLRWRMADAGIERVAVPDARVHHTRDRTAAGHRPAWRYYYEVRNTIYLRTRVRRRRALRRGLPVVARLTVRILLRERGRPRKLWLVGRGIADGVTGRLGRRVPLVADGG